MVAARAATVAVEWGVAAAKEEGTAAAWARPGLGAVTMEAAEVAAAAVGQMWPAAERAIRGATAATVVAWLRRWARRIPVERRRPVLVRRKQRIAKWVLSRVPPRRDDVEGDRS
jgi:hypothetical protein